MDFFFSVCLFLYERVFRRRIRRPFNYGRQASLIVRCLLLHRIRRFFCHQVIMRHFTRYIISAFMRPVFNLFITLMIRMTILLDRFRVFSSRVPSFFGPRVMVAKVDRCFQTPAKFKNQGRIRNITRLHHYRFYFFRIIAVHLVSSSPIHRLRSPTLSTLRFISDANGLSRRRRVSRQISDHLTLSSASHFSGCHVRSNDFTGGSHFAYFANGTAWKAY